MSGHGGWGGRWRGPGWRGAGWRGPGPPPWWPQGEAWPPAGRPTWPRMGRRFMWRVAWFMAAAFLLMAVVLAIGVVLVGTAVGLIGARSEEHTSELQSHSDLVCRLLLEKKKK